jgi:hypothetical protein
MNISEKIQNDYNVAVQTNSSILKYALDDLLNLISSNRNNENDIFDSMECLIEERGQKIIRTIRKNHISTIEIDVYVMNLYNQYLTTFKYKKDRRIVLKTMTDEVMHPHENWNKKIEAEPKVIQMRRNNLIEKLKVLFWF